ncbi:hypothetical protein V490_07277 [Pseudogymnoascus sp. VKM F-3557]|nr:hypothetical protein V490_07277 [Pseudogymnoascus sp. VKM F-3557]
MASPKVEPFLCLPFDMTPAGFHITLRYGYNPVVGSGPFITAHVPTKVQLGHGVMSMMAFCAAKKLCGLTVTSLARYCGFDNKGHVLKSLKKLSGDTAQQVRERKRFGHAIRDIGGDFVTLNSVVMCGNRIEDQEDEGGTTTEVTFKKQKGDMQLWWNQLYYGANTSDVKLAKEFANRWKDSVIIDSTDPEHLDSVADYDERMYTMASARVRAGTAHPLECKFVQRWEGEEDDEDDSSSIASEVDDDDQPMAKRTKMRGEFKSAELVSDADEEDDTTQPPVAPTGQKNDAAQPLVAPITQENNAPIADPLIAHTPPEINTTLPADNVPVAGLLTADQTASNIPISDDDEPDINALKEFQRKALQDAERFENEIKAAKKKAAEKAAAEKEAAEKEAAAKKEAAEKEAAAKKEAAKKEAAANNQTASKALAKGPLLSEADSRRAAIQLLKEEQQRVGARLDAERKRKRDDIDGIQHDPELQSHHMAIGEIEAYTEGIISQIDKVMLSSKLLKDTASMDHMYWTLSAKLDGKMQEFRNQIDGVPPFTFAPEDHDDYQLGEGISN